MVGQSSSSSSLSSHPRPAGAFLVAAGIVNIMITTVAEALYPNYNVGINALSDLGAVGHQTSTLWNTQLLIAACLYFIGILLAFRGQSFLIERRKLTTVLYLHPSIGLAMVSLFPENTITALHVAGALIAFIFGGISSIYAYRFTESPFRYFSVALGILSIASTVLLITGKPIIGFGLIERLAVYPSLIWVISFGTYLMSVR